MMTRVTPPFVSFAQNREDVVLNRAFAHLATGTYLEVGANWPTEDSISRSFYDRGWSGITIEPVASMCEAHRRERDRDTQVCAAAGRPGAGPLTLHRIAGTGLSTTVDAVGDSHRLAGMDIEDVEVPSTTVDDVLAEHMPADAPLHFAVIDTEGAEEDVLAGFDLARWGPWVLVIEATAPNSREPTHDAWEPGVLAAGYRLCQFDGLSRFYVHQDHADRLGPDLSLAASPVDGYVLHREVDLRRTVDELQADVIRWRTAALTRWADAVAQRGGTSEDREPADALRAELDRTRQTISRRSTAPLRAVRRRAAR